MILPKSDLRSPSSDRNILCFVLFRIFFTARFYYPVFAILFLDYGLSMSQFALLNAVWAGVIVLGEVPFGALADRMGRKPLVVAAAVLMVLEMGVLLLAPVGVPEVAFWFFLANRVLSGCAEALASGADEALAYDSLVADGRESEWPEVLKRMMSWQSGAFFFAMLIGGACFDAVFVNQILTWFGSSWSVVQEQTVRFPVILTFVTGCLALVVSLLMTEPSVASDSDDAEADLSSWAEFKKVMRWLLGHKVVLGLIVMGLLYDSTVRMLITLGSEYLRLIRYPEATFGVLGAITAGLGWVSAAWGKKLVDSYSRSLNLLILGGVGFLGLLGVSWQIPYGGYLFWIFLMIGFGLLGFFMSTYINEETASKQRATVLSIKSMAFNLAYGGVGLLYAGWTAILKRGETGPEVNGETIFADSLVAFPIYFFITYFLGWMLLSSKLDK